MKFFHSCPRMFSWYAHLLDGQMKSTCFIFNYWRKHLCANYMKVFAVLRDRSIALQDIVGVWNHLSKLLNTLHLIRYRQRLYPLIIWQKMEGSSCNIYFCMMQQGCCAMVEGDKVKSCVKAEHVESPSCCGNQQDEKVRSMEDNASTTEPVEKATSHARAASPGQASTCYVGKHRHSPSRSAGRGGIYQMSFCKCGCMSICSYSKKEENYFQILIAFYEIIAKQSNNWFPQICY